MLDIRLPNLKSLKTSTQGALQHTPTRDERAASRELANFSSERRHGHHEARATGRRQKEDKQVLF